MPDITQNDGWNEIWAMADPNESWLTDLAKCSEIQGRLSIFNQNHSEDPQHIDNVIKALSRGFHLTKAAVEWDNPVAGNTLANSSTANARGIQWQLVMAYGGFESVTKTLMYLTGEKNSYLSIDRVQDFTSKCNNLPDYIPLQPPNTNRKNLDKWLTKSPPETGDELLDFLSLKNGDRNKIKDWLVNSNQIEDWANATMLAKALRNATAHGALSPTKIEKWGLKPAMKILVKNLGDLVVFGLQTLASSRV